MLGASLVGLLLAGCATTLRPAPGAMTVPSWGRGAMGEADGVRIVAQPGAWAGYPRHLETEITPVLVRIDDDGHHRLRLRREDFTLVAADGRQLSALAPFAIRGMVPEPVVGFHDPYWDDPFYTGYPFYDYPAFAYVPLPTGDMIQKALPETVVERGARAEGYLYFPLLQKRDRGPMTFTAQLVDADTQQPFATVTIPFVAQ